MVVLRHDRAACRAACAPSRPRTEESPRRARRCGVTACFREPWNQPVQELSPFRRVASGSRLMRVTLRTAPPQSGRRSSSSGRASATTKIGEVASPGQQVLHEVEQSLVGPVQVLEDEHGRRLRRDPFEEGAPGGEELLAPVAGQLVETQQAGQRAARPSGAPRGRPRTARAWRSASAGRMSASSPSAICARSRTISASAQ